jgi:hypothetical protein
MNCPGWEGAAMRVMVGLLMVILIVEIDDLVLLHP